MNQYDMRAPGVSLDDDQASTVIDALRVAATTYDADAARLGTPSKTNAARWAAGLTAQAVEARKLADELECGS